MNKQQDLREKYLQYPNRKLIEILRYRKDYTEKAVSQVEKILKERSISQEEIDEILDELNEQDKIEERLLREPLSRKEKILFFCVPIIGFIFYLYLRYKNEEVRYSRRIAESLIYTLLGTLFVTMILALILRE